MNALAYLVITKINKINSIGIWVKQKCKHVSLNNLARKKKNNNQIYHDWKIIFRSPRFNSIIEKKNKTGT
jgi:hypothetical protein